MNRHLRKDDELQVRGESSPRYLVLDGHPRDGHVKVFDRVPKREEVLRLNEVNAQVIRSELIIIRKGAPKRSLASQNCPKLQTQIDCAMKQLAAVNSYRETHDVSFNVAYAEVSKELADDKFASRATLYRRSRALRRDLPILRGDKNKGNRRPRYEQEIVDIVVEEARELYLIEGSVWTLRDLTDNVNMIVHDRGLIPDTKTVSRAFVNKTIHEQCSNDPEYDRLNPKDRAAAKSIASKRIVVRQPFERIEQDAVHLPFVITTEHGNRSDVWLIHAIDCSTGVPVGWKFVLGAPRESDGIECIESILYPKDAEFARLNMHVDMPSMYGTPIQLVFDNGPEARGDRIRGLSALGADITHCKSRHPHLKPFIERLNRSLKEALQILKGSTRFNGKDGQRDPIAHGDELMTLEELERWVVRWYFEKWIHVGLKRHAWSDFHNKTTFGGTPAKRWSALIAMSYAMPLSPPIAEWQMAKFVHDRKPLCRKTGILYDTYHYKGDAIVYLIHKYGEVEVKILVNPDDYRRIYVYDGEGMPLVELVEEYVTDATPAYTFSQMKKIKSEVERVAPQNEASKQFDRDRFAASRAGSAPKARKPSNKRAEAKHVAGLAQEADARQRAVSNPIRSTAAASNGQGTSTMTSFDDVSAFQVLNRHNGQEIL